MGDTVFGSAMRSIADGIANSLNNQELARQKAVAQQQAIEQFNKQEAIRNTYEMQRQMAVAQVHAQAMAGNHAITQAAREEAGKAKTRSQLQAGQTAVDRNSLREVAQYTGGGKMDMFGNIIGIDPEQAEMVSFLTPVSKVKGLLQRAATYPEYLDLAKQQVAQSYGLKNPEDINKRLNLIASMPLEDAVRNAEFLRRGTLEKAYAALNNKGEKLAGTVDWNKVDTAKQAYWKGLEGRYKPSSAELKVPKLNITTMGAVDNETETPSSEDGSEFLQ